MERDAYIKEFMTLLDECLEILRFKSADYADTDNSFANFEMCEQVGLCPTQVGIAVRLGDKYKRICNLLQRPNQVKDESIEDTLKDSIIYSGILLLYLRHKRGFK